jgi:hypothetical protein
MISARRDNRVPNRDGVAQKATSMSFGTKHSKVGYKPMVLATSTRISPASTNPPPIQIEREIISGARARYFSNASTFVSSTALPRPKQVSETSKALGIALSALVTALFVFGVFYWSTQGTFELPPIF